MLDHHIRLVVFDLAGTTVRDDGQVPSAFTTPAPHARRFQSIAQLPEVIQATP